MAKKTLTESELETLRFRTEELRRIVALLDDASTALYDLYERELDEGDEEYADVLEDLESDLSLVTSNVREAYEESKTQLGDKA